ncbi:hypothetical protein K503DRAFT_685615 [Rhizopogon vinicolor AM-OR11-026]|uniref:RING-type domain-containing protein n=1 Tax=Rhizopogon vinicolor AM-OR11-026 TaxID=1314800 RepID=A0A1B7N908_9AGAM|nr:hypothetical protein K503DRAFT_685615 [Rhizopogon vinicolor AM-OR11-026]
MEPILAAGSPGFLELVAAHRSSRPRIQELVTHLPKITETELKDMGHSESICPICFNTFLAILAEEEMALVMDSPAHPVEELGVTRLHETCGHLFCRRELSPRSIVKWIQDGRDSCPTCRRPYITADEQHGIEQPPVDDDLDDSSFPWIIERSMVRQGIETVITESGNADLLPVLVVPSAAMGSNLSAHRAAAEFSGMYS